MRDHKWSVLVTGANGFIGKNLIASLSRREDIGVLAFDVEHTGDDLARMMVTADIIFHLAGVNRPPHDSEFEAVNTGLTRILIELLSTSERKPPVIFASSIQAERDNPYGLSKLLAEQELIKYQRDTGGEICIFRLPNVFGKWCRPNYNSVVATFCHNVANGIELRVDDPSAKLTLVYIDDLVASFVAMIGSDRAKAVEPYYEVGGTFGTTVGDLARIIGDFGQMRSTLQVPDMADRFTRCLYATYLSYLGTADFSYRPATRTDHRGSLTELLKSDHFGQVFISTSHGGVMRGNHYHDTKVEKFCVVRGNAVIRFRHILDDSVIEYPVSGETIEIVDIPPGYTHSIENVSGDELVVLFWAGEVFDSGHPDTWPAEVAQQERHGVGA